MESMNDNISMDDLEKLLEEELENISECDENCYSEFNKETLSTGPVDSCDGDDILAYLSEFAAASVSAISILETKQIHVVDELSSSNKRQSTRQVIDLHSEETLHLLEFALQNTSQRHERLLVVDNEAIFEDVSEVLNRIVDAVERNSCFFEDPPLKLPVPILEPSTGNLTESNFDDITNEISAQHLSAIEERVADEIPEEMSGKSYLDYLVSKDVWENSRDKMELSNCDDNDEMAMILLKDKQEREDRKLRRLEEMMKWTKNKSAVSLLKRALNCFLNSNLFPYYVGFDSKNSPSACFNQKDFTHDSGRGIL